MVSFISKIEGCKYIEALIKLFQLKLGNKIIDNYDHKSKDKKNRKELTKGARIFFETLPEVDWDCEKKNYMFERGFLPRTLKHFDVRTNELSSYPIVIPLYERHRFKGYVARLVSKNNDTNKCKYLYNRGFSRASVVAGCPTTKYPLLIAEGTLDWMKAWQYDYCNSVSILGWYAAKEQLKKLSKYKQIICATDNDSRGAEGFLRIRAELTRSEVIRFEFPPDKKDIDEMSENEFARSIYKSLRSFS